MNRLVLILLAFVLVLFSCETDSNPDGGVDAESDGHSSHDTEPEPTGALNWDNWSCTTTSGGCVATYQSKYTMICNPSYGQCNYGTQSGSWYLSCFDFEGTGCDACESAFYMCAQEEIAAREN